MKRSEVKGLHSAKVKQLLLLKMPSPPCRQYSGISSELSPDGGRRSGVTAGTYITVHVLSPQQ